MWGYLCFIVLLKIASSEEIVKAENDVVSDFFNLFSNVTVTNATTNQNQTFDNQRITQPSPQTLQTQQIERTIQPIVTNNSRNNTNKLLSGFRPSPQLETYYEFNKFPVVPAFPEAKHFPSFNFGGFTGDNVQWPGKSVSFPTTTEQTWTAKVKFPAPTVQTSKERPYKFDVSMDKSYPTKLDGFDFTKPVLEKPKSFDSSNWDIWKQRQKNQFDFTAPVPYGGNTHKTHFDYGVEKPHSEVENHGYSGNPWKKIIKFLTAFIPIGLLISALTPTVITVSAMNGTQSRGRAEDSTHQNTKKLISSINYFNNMNSNGCENRILCELLVSASESNNAEQHVQNLLNTFTENGKATERTEEMKKVFEAVRKQDCRPIICKNIKETT